MKNFFKDKFYKRQSGGNISGAKKAFMLIDFRLKVLIVDDSQVFRSMVEEILRAERGIEVVGSVKNGAEAIEFIKTNPPDLVSLDYEMPRMDGYQTLKAIQRMNEEKRFKNDIGVIMVSSFTTRSADITMKSLDLGAFDFVTKPIDGSRKENIAFLRSQYLVKIRHYATSRICGRRERTKLNSAAPPAGLSTKTAISRAGVNIRPKVALSSIKAILIGVSTGGPKALFDMVPGLSAIVKLPIFIVQHMPPEFTLSLAKTLDEKCRHKVMECNGHNIAQNDNIIIAPGGKHMELKVDSLGRVIAATNLNPPENACRPAVDVMFRSAARIYGGDVIAIILTGMGADGVKGLQILKRAGAFAIAQDEESSVVWGMPGSAVAAGVADEVLPLTMIPGYVGAILNRNKR